MHRSRFPLKEWFWAAYLVATHTPVMSATQLRRQMDVAIRLNGSASAPSPGMVSASRSRLRGREKLMKFSSAVRYPAKEAEEWRALNIVCWFLEP